MVHLIMLQGRNDQINDRLGGGDCHRNMHPVVNFFHYSSIYIRGV